VPRPKEADMPRVYSAPLFSRGRDLVVAGPPVPGVQARPYLFGTRLSPLRQLEAGSELVKRKPALSGCAATAKIASGDGVGT
jgi:hypothetical protein